MIRKKREGYGLFLFVEYISYRMCFFYNIIENTYRSALTTDMSRVALSKELVKICHDASLIPSLFVSTHRLRRFL